MAATRGWELVTSPDAENPDEGDLKVSKRSLVRLSTFGDQVAQAVRVRLKWFRGEWFLDTRQGVPYLQEIFGKGVSLATVRNVLRREIVKVAGVFQVRKLDLDLDTTTRKLSAEIDIVTTEGEDVPLGTVDL